MGKKQKRSRRSGIIDNILAAAVWEGIIKPLILAALATFGLSTATIKNFIPERNWPETMIAALLVTLSIFVPVLILIVSFRRPRPFSTLAQLGDWQMKGRELRSSVPTFPRTETTDRDVEAWIEEVEEWTQIVINFLQEECSLHAGVRFVDDSNMQAGHYENVPEQAQASLRGLHRRLANLSAIMDTPDAYCQ